MLEHLLNRIFVHAVEMVVFYPEFSMMICSTALNLDPSQVSPFPYAIQISLVKLIVLFTTSVNVYKLDKSSQCILLTCRGNSRFQTHWKMNINEHVFLL